MQASIPLEVSGIFVINDLDVLIAGLRWSLLVQIAIEKQENYSDSTDYISNANVINSIFWFTIIP